jgi:hypothetical protein
MKTNIIIPVKNHNDFLGTQTLQNELNVKYIFVIDLSSNKETIDKSKILNDLYPYKNLEVYYVDFQNIKGSTCSISEDFSKVTVWEPYLLNKV